MFDPRCDHWREALSARLDGEASPGTAGALDRHLAGCVDCRDWYARAEAVTRLVRTGLPTESPGVDDAVLDTAPGRSRARAAATLRGLLGVIGAAQFLLGIAQINTVVADGYLHPGPTPFPAGHLWHESAAWNIAIGAGFGWIAVRRTRPASLVPVLTAFVAMLALLSANDAITGEVDVGRLLSHGLVIAGYLVVLVLSRPAFDFDDPTGQHDDGRRSRWRIGADLDRDSSPGGSGVARARLPSSPLGDPASEHRHAA